MGWREQLLVSSIESEHKAMPKMVRDKSIDMLHYVVLPACGPSGGNLKAIPLLITCGITLASGSTDRIYLPLSFKTKSGIAKKKKAKGNRKNNIGRVKYYNCRKKGSSA